MKSLRAQCSEKGNPDLDNISSKSRSPSQLRECPMTRLDQAPHLLATEFRCSGLALEVPGRVDLLLSMTPSPSSHSPLQEPLLSMVVNGTTQRTLGASQRGLPEGSLVHLTTCSGTQELIQRRGWLIWENTC